MLDQRLLKKSRMNKAKHYLIRTQEGTGEPCTYCAPCGFESTNAKEFTSISNPSSAGVTCSACLEKLHKSTVIVAER
jgi:hypothetical protein